MADNRLTEAMALMCMRLNMLYLSAILEDYIEERNKAGAAVDRNGGQGGDVLGGG